MFSSFQKNVKGVAFSEGYDKKIEQVKPWVKTSLAPGSGVVTKYLLQRYKLEPLNHEIHNRFSPSL